MGMMAGNKKPVRPRWPILTPLSQGIAPAYAGAASPGLTKPVNFSVKPPLRSVKMKICTDGWMNFYTKVLSRFAANKGLKLTLTVDVSQNGGASEQKIEETKVALRELGLNDNVRVEGNKEENA